MHNTCDMSRNTPYMEFASILKNIYVMKLDTASCRLLMTTFTQAKSVRFKGDLKTDVNHNYVRARHDATREGSSTVAKENGFHRAMCKTVLRKIQ